MFGYYALPRVLDDIAATLIKTDVDHLVAGVRYPEEGLRVAVDTAGAPFVVALPDPRTAVRDLVAETNAELRTAVRAVANSCALVMPFLSVPGALVLRGGEFQTCAEMILAIGRHLGVGIGESDAGEIAVGLEHKGLWDPLASNDRTVGIVESDEKMVEGALASYATAFVGGGLGEIVWTRDLFDPVGGIGTMREPFELEGGVRYLTYGPYIYLPPGSWNARVTLGLSARAGGHNILVDAFANRQLASTGFQPESPGIYTAEINFSLDPASGQGLEIRAMIASEFARGQLAFGNVVLTPRATRHSENRMASGDFQAALKL